MIRQKRRSSSRTRSDSRTREEPQRKRRERSSSRGRGAARRDPGHYGPTTSSKFPREDVELFIGNIAEGQASDEMMRDFLNLAMKESGLVPADAPDPIIKCTVAGKYGFMEFSSPENCTLGLNLNGIPFLGTLLKINRPQRYSGPFTEARTWQELTGDTFIPPSSQSEVKRSSRNPMNVAAKSLFEVFLGNVTDEMTNESVREFLGGALQKVCLSSTGIENPILDVKINANKFAFVTCRSVEDASNMLNLNGIPFGNQNLKIERPSKFEGGIPGIVFYNWTDLFALWNSGDLKLLTAGAPTPILKLSNMATIKELMDDIFYVDLLEDIRAECSQHGNVKSIIIPRKNRLTNLSPDLESAQVFVEMSNPHEAKNVLLNIKGRTFNGRSVDAKFYPEDRFRYYDYTLDYPPPIITYSYGPVKKEQVLTADALSKL